MFGHSPSHAGRLAEPKPRKPSVVFQPGTYRGLKQGVSQLVNAMRPTLGPLSRTVVLQKSLGALPEVLEDGSTIARRIIELPNRDADVGAMLLRHAVWKMHEEVGDGTTTMAVIFQSILSQGIRYVTAGQGNAMRLRLYLQHYADIVAASLREGAVSLSGRDDIAKMALGLCHDHELALLLGEVFDIVGAEGMVEVESSNGRGLEREYVEGAYWDNSGWFSSRMETDSVRHQATLDDVAILVSDSEVQDPRDLIPVMDQAVRAKIPNLVVVAYTVSDKVVGLLLRNRQAQVIGTLAVRVPMLGTIDLGALEDIAVLTGGRLVCRAAGERLETIRLEDLGRARRAWATDERFGIVGGKGGPRRLRQHIATVRARISKADGEEREKLRRRLGQLVGGVAMLRVGGSSSTEVETRKARAERTVLAVRAAMDGKVVPGGGTALLKCQAALANVMPKDCDEEAACRILGRALEEPLRVIAANAGYVPEIIVHQVKAAPAGHGFDACAGRVVDMRQAGIMDAVPVLDKALRMAVSGAAMALTTDVIVHRRQPPETIEP